MSHCQDLPPSLAIPDMNLSLNSQPPRSPHSIRLPTMTPGSGTGASSILFKYLTRCRHNTRYLAILGSTTSSSTSLHCKLLMRHRPSPKLFPKGLSTTSLLCNTITRHRPSPKPVLKGRLFHLEFQGKMYSRVLSFFRWRRHFQPSQPPPRFILHCFDRICLKLETPHRNFRHSYLCLSTTLLPQC